jgi:hypothetical protein
MGAGLAALSAYPAIPVVSFLGISSSAHTSRNAGLSHTIKTLNSHFSATTTHVVEVAASVNYLSSWTSPIILHRRNVVV